MDGLETSVLIVGGGPVGLAMSLELGSRGIDCLVIEQTDGQALLPRASGLSPRTMEFCRRWGIAEQVYHGGFPLDHHLDIIYCTGITGFELAREERPALQDQPPLSYSPERAHRLPQDLFDPILEKAARDCPGVDIRRRCRLVGFENVGDHVLCYLQRLDDRGGYDFNESSEPLRLSLANLPFPPSSSVRARYVVACDGVMSGVRAALGIGIEGAGGGDAVLSYSLSAIVRIADFAERHDKGDAERFFILDSGGIWANLTAVDGRDRWRLTITGSREKMDLSNLDVDGWVRRTLGPSEMPFSVEAVTPWRRRQQVATDLSRGRVMLAGDACHAMSPTGGLGLNTGLGDVVNLGWKLEAALKGWAGEGLLASYDAERGPVARRNTKAAADNFRRYAADLDYSLILDTSADGERARALIGSSIKDRMSRQVKTDGANLGYRYASSPVIVPDGTPEPPDDLVTYVQAARPGSHVPHVRLSDGQAIFSLLGDGFTLLDFGGEAEAAEPLLRSAQERGVPMAHSRIDDEGAAALYGRRYVLVRPDRHVAWRGDNLPFATEALVNRIRGA